MGISQENIKQMVNEAVSFLGHDGIYDLALSQPGAYSMVKAMSEVKDLTAEEIAINFSVAGFMAGIQFALENAEFKEVEDEGE